MLIKALLVWWHLYDLSPFELVFQEELGAHVWKMLSDSSDLFSKWPLSQFAFPSGDGIKFV